jgi:hypothetical protein
VACRGAELDPLIPVPIGLHGEHAVKSVVSLGVGERGRREEMENPVEWILEEENGQEECHCCKARGGKI